jgi:hypothetical protein
MLKTTSAFSKTTGMSTRIGSFLTLLLESAGWESPARTNPGDKNAAAQIASQPYRIMA